MAAAAKQRYEARLKKEALKASDDFDWSAIISLIEPSLEKVYEAGAKASAKDLGVSPFDKLNERARDYARDRGAELVGMRYNEDGDLVPNPDAEWVITDTTRDAIRSLEDKAFKEGLSPDELAEQINDLIDDPDRASMIADTDLALAQSEGSLDAWKESGVVEGKEAILSGDHDLDDVCDENADAGVIPVDDDFPSGDQTSPFHPRCDCDVVAVVQGSDEEDEAA